MHGERIGRHGMVLDIAEGDDGDLIPEGGFGAEAWHGERGKSWRWYSSSVINDVMPHNCFGWKLPKLISVPL